MRYLLPLLALHLFLGPCARAQDTPREVIETLFASMYAGDSTGMHALFLPGATLQTATEEGLDDTPPETWMSFLHGKPKGSLDEQLDYIEVEESGPLATAWTPYTFIRDGELSHCGVNSWVLLKTDGKWRIKSIIDTRTREGCVDEYATAKEEVEDLVRRWHLAAAEADSATYFGLMSDNSVFVGTDKTEIWSKEQFASFAGPYFAKGKAWEFKTVKSNFTRSDNHPDVIYWHELLDGWMGPCWGTGVAVRENGEWKIDHFTLAVTLDNDLMDGFLELTGKEKR